MIKMNNKILVKVIPLELDKSYDVFIPVNEYIFKISKMITKVAYNILGFDVNIMTKEYFLVNRKTGRIYKNNELVIDTDIRNGTELILIPSNASDYNVEK